LARRIQAAFFLLIAAQAAHSCEEFVTRLFEVFAPARYVSGLVSNDLAAGFLVVNTVLVGFGLWCWVIPVRSGWRSGEAIIWFWTILELGNGAGHLALAATRGGYFPGAGTAPLLLLLSAWLAVLQTGARYTRP
jgi:hypothetical protein